MTTIERNKLVTENLGIAYALVAHYAKWNKDREELQSIAQLAMCEAAADFDPGRGKKFSSWAHTKVEQALLRHLHLGWAAKNTRREPLDLLHRDGSIYRTEKGDEEVSGEERFASHLPTPEGALLQAESARLLGDVPEKLPAHEAEAKYFDAFGELAEGTPVQEPCLSPSVYRTRRWYARLSPEKKRAREDRKRAWSRRAMALGLPWNTTVKVIRAVEAQRRVA